MNTASWDSSCGAPTKQPCPMGSRAGCIGVGIHLNTKEGYGLLFEERNVDFLLASRFSQFIQSAGFDLTDALFRHS